MRNGLQRRSSATETTHAERPATAEQAATPPLSIPAPELLRRALLGLVAALLVARPLLGGADSGLLQPDAGVGTLWLVLLWLLAAVAWAGWRIWTGQTGWRRGFVEPTLLALTVLIFLSVPGGARLRQAGWLFAWEWLAVFLAFIIVRQLPCSERETRSLLAVVLATGVGLAAQSLLQAALPIAATSVEPIVGMVHGLRATKPVNAVPFGDAATFAAYLAMLLPALAVACFLVGQTKGGLPWRLALTGACLLLPCLALGLTGYWQAVVALLLANLVLLGAGRSHLPKSALQLGLVVSIGGIALVLGLAATRGDLAIWWRSWLENLAISRQVIEGNAGYGVGPTAFDRHYTAFLPAPSAHRAGAPANFLLEVLAGCGYWVLGMLVVLLAVYVWRVWPSLCEPWSASEEAEPPAPRPSGLAWEFYLGGTLGLTFAILVQLSDETSQRELGLKAAPLALRSLVWLAAFSLLESIPWTPRWRAVALFGGLAAGLFCLCVTGGFLNPSFALTLWVLAALALQAATRDVAKPLPGGRLATLVPVTVLALLWWTYLLVFVYPIARASSLVADARRAYPEWRNVEEPRWRQAIDRRHPLRAQHEAARAASAFLQDRILKPLDEAVQLNAGGIGPRAELAYWYGRSWEVFALMRVPADEPLTVREVRDVQKAQANFALQHLSYGIERVDPPGHLPIGREFYRVGWRLRYLFAEQPGMSPEDRQDQYRMAANGHLRQLLLGEPMSPELHFRLADALHRADPKDNVEWRQEAERALELDRQASAGPLRLSAAQRQEIDDWSWMP
ncbi:MAG: hypothetical protein JNM56_07440 [Planctomycetia bacterium]|nr:hypothetical protein [Planctomycetia bacterium]